MVFFDLESDPTTAIKSKSSGGKTPIDVSDFRPKNKKPIGTDWDVNPGDILSWGDYRSSNTYFVTAQRLLRKNRDTSGSGYLTIPLSITRLFPFALKHYGSLLESDSDLVSAIEIGPKDGIFVEKFGSSLPESICNRKDISFLINPMENSFFVTINGVDSDGFSIDETKTEDIVEYINSANEKQAAFIVDYDIQGKELYDKWPQDKPKGLPVGWFREQHDGTAGSCDSIKGVWRFHGPEKSKETAYNLAQEHYDGFGVNIHWETETRTNSTGDF